MNGWLCFLRCNKARPAPVGPLCAPGSWLVERKSTCVVENHVFPALRSETGYRRHTRKRVVWRLRSVNRRGMREEQSTSPFARPCPPARAQKRLGPKYKVCDAAAVKCSLAGQINYSMILWPTTRGSSRVLRTTQGVPQITK